MKKILYAFFPIFLLAFCFFFVNIAQAASATVVHYTFEDGIKRANSNNSSTFVSNPYTADDGVIGNINYSAIGLNGGNVFTAWNGGSGVSSPFAPNSNNWDTGSSTKYWYISFSTVGYKDLKLSSKQYSSPSGPAGFKVQWSLNGSSWTDVTGSNITVKENWSSGVLNSLALPSAIQDKSKVYLRWIMISNTAVNGSTVPYNGASRIDDIYIVGTLMNIGTWNFEDVAKRTAANFTTNFYTADDGIVGIKNVAPIKINGPTFSGFVQGYNDAGSAPNANSWDSGSNTKYWYVTLSTAGHEDLKLSSRQNGSNTGPRDFKIQWSLNNSSWTDVTNITVGNNWTSGFLNSVTLPPDIQDKSTVYLRWITTSNVSINSEVVGDTGTDRIDDIIIDGKRIRYTLNYIAGANGALSGTTTQYVYYKENGSTVTATPNANYHFVNWSDGVSTTFRTNNSVTTSVTATANFAINTYTLTYTAGANGSITGSSTQTVNHGASSTAVSAVADVNYHFVNWSDGNITNPRTDTNVIANNSVTANFAIDTFTLNYIAGANGFITGSSTQTVNYGTNGSAVTATPNANYHFVKWSDGIIDNPRSDLFVTGTINVTAEWALDTYTITYDSNGNTSGISPINQTKTYGIDLILNSNTGALIKTGYTFSGWNTVADGSGTHFAEGDNFTTNNTTTLYAEWNISTYVISYDGNSNTGGTTPLNQTKTYGIDLTLNSNTGALVKTGYTFSGWNTVADGSGTHFAEGGNFTTNNTIALYAEWTVVSNSSSGGSSMPAGAYLNPETSINDGQIIINNNNEIATSQNVNIFLGYQSFLPKITGYALSNSPDFSSASIYKIEDYEKNGKVWDLCQDKNNCLNGVYTVYTKFFTQWGRDSGIYQDTIKLVAKKEGFISPSKTTTTPCQVPIYLKNNVKFGAKNDPEDVKLLEHFLNNYEGHNLPIDGIYSIEDRDIVIKWQEKYAEEILKPWGLTKGTGDIYTTSLKKIAQIYESLCKTENKEQTLSDYIFDRDLETGMSGNDVKELQKYFNNNGFILANKGPGSPSNETEFFGALTRETVINFQLANRISPAVGYFGPITRKVVNK